MTTFARRGRVAIRIVVALNAPTRSLPTLEMASALAARLDAELEALFVEEEELMRAASLPFAREVDRISGATRPLDTGLMARVLRTEAASLERLLARACTGLATSPKLRVVRGHYLAEALSVAATADMTILYRARRTLEEERGASARTARRRRRRPIWVVFDDAPESARALEVSAELARTLGNELVVMVPGAQGDAAARIEQEARTQLAEIGASARFVEVPSAQPDDLQRAIGRAGADLLVLGRAIARLEEGAAVTWLEDTGTPVMLVA
ncbi:MAG: universal stress protein [Gammaproteobacteria bacterium]|nr:universal stress protein [Gammaproteobacteria bacterium]